MKRVSTLQIIVVHLCLALVTAAVLYPVLWVIKMALDPSQSFSMGLSPIPETVSLEAVPFPRGIGHPIGIVPTPLVPTRDEIASVADQPDELRLGEGFSEHGCR